MTVSKVGHVARTSSTELKKSWSKNRAGLCYSQGTVYGIGTKRAFLDHYSCK